MWGTGYYSCVRNKIAASNEAVHDHAIGGPALKKSAKPFVSKKKGTSEERTHDEVFEDVGLSTICASHKLTNPSIAYSPGEATSLA